MSEEPPQILEPPARARWQWLAVAIVVGLVAASARSEYRPLLATGPLPNASLLSQESALEAVRPSWEIRALLVVVALAIWHATQRLLGERPTAPAEQAEQVRWYLTQHDGLLRLLEPVNHFLHRQPRWANGLLIVSSALIDGLGLFLLVWSVVGPSLRPLLGLCLLFGLRQVCQALTALPLPKGAIWRYPGLPSLLVTYGVANDLFFSGHTALAVYGAVELAGLGSPWLVGLAVVIALFETAAVLCLRAHYTMDVFAGLVTALYVAGIAAAVALPCDRLLVGRPFVAGSSGLAGQREEAKGQGGNERGAGDRQDPGPYDPTGDAPAHGT